MTLSGVSVGFDREIFLLQDFGGISNYFSKLIKTFLIDPTLRVTPNLTFNRTNNSHLLELSDISDFNLHPARKFIKSKSGVSTSLTYGPLHNLTSTWAGGNNSKSNFDIFHATYYRPTYSEKSKGKIKAITIHDFIPEKLGWDGVRNPHIGKRKLLMTADIIFCVSKSTAIDLYNYTGIDDYRVVIAHHGVEILPNRSTFLNRNMLNRESILYVGHRSGYKNFEILPKAMHTLKKRIPDLFLVLAGPELERGEAEKLNLHLGENNWATYTRPNQETLNQLYSTAKLHCVTSLFEGFGMTILEAMSFGTSVLASDIPVFREVGGSHTCYFNPKSVENLADSIESYFMADSGRKLSLQNVNHAKEFSWEKSALIHAQAYLGQNNFYS